MIIFSDGGGLSSLFVRSTCCFGGQGKAIGGMRCTDGRTYTERRCHLLLHRATNSRLFLYSLFVFISTLISNCSAHSIACDFSGSGLDIVGKGIQPVYLSCSSGRIDWRHPRSALRIVLQYPGEKRDFRGCIMVSPEIEGARLFLEGHRSLVPLYSKGDGQPKERRRCFTSYHGLIALYLEADPSLGFTDLKASFEYDLQPLHNGAFYDPLQECRPCTVAELVQLYCSADFAAKGLIISTEDDELLQQTRVILAASKVFQQTAPVFSKADPSNFASSKGRYFNLNYSEEVDNNVIPEGDLGDSSRLFGQLYMPIECGARAGDGEFMVLGNIKLGQPVLRCAPRIQQWKDIVKSAQDSAHCVLQS